MSQDNNFLARRGFLIKTLMCVCLLSAICNNLKDIQLMIPSSLLPSYYILKLAVVPEFLYFCAMSCGNSIRIYGKKMRRIQVCSQIVIASSLQQAGSEECSWHLVKNSLDFEKYSPFLRQRKCRSLQCGLELSFSL